jgi:glycosyltransferase involved in cell wall biosynthesis
MQTASPERLMSKRPKGAATPSSHLGGPTVLIGPMSQDPAESVSTVNRAFTHGLASRFEFISVDATRNVGNNRQATFNVVNLFYFVWQFAGWCIAVICRKPRIAHYAISSGWAMEKGLAFMKVARMFGVRTLAHFHDGAFIDKWNQLPVWRRRFAHRQLRQLDGLVLASRWWSDEVQKHIPLPNTKFFVVNNPIEPGFEQRALQMTIERTGNMILALGVMGRAKGVLDLVEAASLIARENCDFTLEIVGAEREPGVMKETCDFIANHSLGDFTKVTAGVDNEEKTKLFAKASILVLPSHYENFPLVLVEAAAAGLAIVTTPVGAVPEFFADEVSALFVEPKKPRQLADALARLIRNPDERLRLGAAAREMFTTRLSRGEIMNSLGEVYAEVGAEAR